MKIRVVNFQSLEDAEIEVEGLTVLTGQNNVGKSALMRAVAGVFSNTPGDSFVRYGQESCSVRLDFKDGRSVEWRKGAKIKPTYILDGGPPLYPGRGVPDEVLDLGIRPVMTGGGAVWPQIAPQISGQLFLLDQSGSVLAEAVSDVERVGRLNTALRSAEQDARSSRATLKVRLDDRVEVKEKLAAMEGLDAVGEEIQALETKRASLGRARLSLDELTALQARLSQARAEVQTLTPPSTCPVPDTTSAVAARQELDLAVQFQGSLREAWRKRDTLKACAEMIEVIPPLDNKADKIADALVVFGGLRDKYRAALGEMGRVEEDLNRARGLLAEADVLVKGHQSGLVKCPTCGK